MSFLRRVHHWVTYSGPGLLGLRDVNSSVTRAEADILRKYAKGKQVLVEIGVFEGFSALEERKVMDPNGELYLIDPYTPGLIPGFNVQEFIARRYLKKSENGKIFWLKDYSYNSARNWSKEIDYLFIDAHHGEEEFSQDFQDWGRFVKRGAVAVFHDAEHGSGTGVSKVVDRLFRKTPANGWVIIEECERMVVVRKD